MIIFVIQAVYLHINIHVETKKFEQLFSFKNKTGFIFHQQVKTG